MESIYENIEGEIMTKGKESNEVRQVYLYDERSIYPSLILPNQAAIRSLRDFLTDCLKEITSSEK